MFAAVRRSVAFASQRTAQFSVRARTFSLRSRRRAQVDE
jgi:hypothetical protein